MTKRESKSTRRRPGRFAYEGLDRVFHEKARLGIMTSLTTQPDGLSFSDLKELCSLSDGNLNRHLAVLQEAGLVKTIKEGGGRGSRTLCVVTRPGRSAFFHYLRELERVIADAATAEKQAAESTVRSAARWSTA
jgi:DNA-binding transcriptional ArsR family regulator